MKAEKKTETRVSKAIAKAWEGSTTAKQAAEKYVAMLKEDQVHYVMKRQKINRTHRI